MIRLGVTWSRTPGRVADHMGSGKRWPGRPPCGPSLRVRRGPGMPTQSRSRRVCRLRCSRSRVHRIGVISSPALRRAPEQGILRRGHVIDGWAGLKDAGPPEMEVRSGHDAAGALRQRVELVRIRRRLKRCSRRRWHAGPSGEAGAPPDGTRRAPTQETSSLATRDASSRGPLFSGTGFDGYISYVDDTTRENMSPTHHNALVGYVGDTPKPTLENDGSAAATCGRVLLRARARGNARRCR